MLALANVVTSYNNGHRPAVEVMAPITEPDREAEVETPDQPEEVRKVMRGITTVANLIQNAAHGDFRSGPVWDEATMVDALGWISWCQEVAECIVHLTGGSLKMELEAKMLELCSGFRVQFPVPFNLAFLCRAVDFFIEGMVLNSSASNSMLEILWKAVMTDCLHCVTTPFHTPEMACQYKKAEHNAMKHITAWKRTHVMDHGKRDFPKNDPAVENYIRELVELLSLWTEASNNSVWFQYKLSHALHLLSKYCHGWSVVVSCLVTDLGRFEQRTRPVVRRLLDLVLFWMLAQYRNQGAACRLWKADVWVMSRASEFNTAFLDWYLHTLEEMGDRLGADVQMIATVSPLSTLNGRDACPASRFSERAEFTQLRARVSCLLGMDRDVQKRVFSLLRSKCRDNLFLWVVLNQELLDEFGSDLDRPQPPLDEVLPCTCDDSF